MELFSGEDFSRAREDPIAPHSKALVEMANSTYAKALRTMCVAPCRYVTLTWPRCQEYGDILVSEAFVFGMDRLGFDLLGKEAASERWVEFRMPWEVPVIDVGEYETRLRQTFNNVGKEGK